MSARTRWMAALASLALALGALACVTADRDRVAEARQRYERCVASAGEKNCRTERERLHAAERAYEHNAQRAWGCDPAQPDCPTKR